MSENIVTEKYTQFVRELRDESKIEADGKATLSIKGMKRLFCLGQRTFQNHLTRLGKPESKTESKLVRRLRSKGFSPESFSRQGVSDAALGIIGNYFSCY